MAKAVIWRVDSPPTGPYKSFQERAWPSCFTNDERKMLLGTIINTEGFGYIPQQAAANNLNLKIRVYDNRQGIVNRKTYTSVGVFSSISEAKAWFEEFLQKNPDYLVIQ